MPDQEKLVVTLTAKRGNKFDQTGECIGTHGRSIIFLPRGAKPDEQVRIVLQPLRDAAGNERTDGRGRTLYRANPAPDMSGEIWKDNGDGTLNRAKTMTDWRGNTRKVGVEETRPLATREGNPTTRSNLRVVWGADLATSVVENAPTRGIPQEDERVVSGRLEWVKTGEREEALPVETYAVKGVAAETWSSWYTNRLKTAYDATAQVIVKAGFRRPTSNWDDIHTETGVWSAMPQWWRDEQEKLYPVCTCGRQRIDSLASQDGYAKCETCRHEEACVRCGAGGRVKQIETRLICADCEPMARQEVLIEQHVAPERRGAVVALVAALLASKAMEGETGQEVLLALAGDVDRNTVEKYSGYPWYYFTDASVYGSRFSPDALEVLAHFDAAAGNGLVRLTAWLAGDEHKPMDRWGDPSRQFYFVTQVRHEEETPNLTEGNLKNLSVAVRLRGSEQKRQEARERLEHIRRKISGRRAEPIEKMLADPDGDEGAALAQITEIETLLARQDAGEALVDFGGHWRRMGSGTSDYWVIRPDGSLRQPDWSEGRRRYERSEGDKSWNTVAADELALEWSKPTTAADHVFVVAKLPMDACSEAQLGKVSDLEDEIAREWPTDRTGMSGKNSPSVGNGWGLVTPTHAARREARRRGIEQACEAMRSLCDTPDLQVDRLVCGETNWIGEQHLQGKPYGLVNWSRPFDVDLGDRRLGQLVESQEAADGMLELFATTGEGSADDRPRFYLSWRRTGIFRETVANAKGGQEILSARRELADEVIRLVGTERSIEIFEAALETRYGRGGRQADIREAIPGLGETDIGRRLLETTKAHTFEGMVEEALHFLRQDATGKTSAPAVPKNDVMSPFTHKDRKTRSFSCPNGHTAQLQKGGYKKYEQGVATAITCSVCGSRGTVLAAVESTATESKASAETDAMSDKLALLSAKFGRKR